MNEAGPDVTADGREGPRLSSSVGLRGVNASRYCRVFGSRLLFVLLAAWLLVCIPLFPYMVHHFAAPGLVPLLIGYIFSSCCLFGLLIAIDARRFGWTVVFITASISAAYIWYFCDTFFIQEMPLRPDGRRSEVSPRNALLGFFVFGLPSSIATVRILRALIGHKKAPTSKNEKAGV